MREKTITGYCDPFSATAGDMVAFKVSTYAPGNYQADLVRLRSGEDSTGGVIAEDVVEADFSGEKAGRHQPLTPGSFAIISEGEPLPVFRDLTVAAWIWPTAPGGRSQTIMSCRGADGRSGFRLFIDGSGMLSLELATSSGDITTLAQTTPLRARHWYQVSASYQSSDGAIRLLAEPHGLSPGQQTGLSSGILDVQMDRKPDFGPEALRVAIAADQHPDGPNDHFNGKIDRPRLVGRSLADAEIEKLMMQTPDDGLGESLLGHWDFSRGISTSRITDLGPGGRHGHLVNLPSRAMTGFNWTGETQCWRDRPEQYGAIHFHDDDLHDAGWDTSFTFRVPADLPSGVYAARLRHGDNVDRIPFVVRPPLGQATAPVAFLMPLASYLAYANYRLRLKANPIFGDGIPSHAIDAFLAQHPELGNSTYDLHTDRSGVQIVSRLRPVMNMKPEDNRPWGLPADCNILAWLDHIGQDYDVITDEDLHDHGDALLKPYRAVITGTHPEYHSTAMLDGIEGWLQQGGRLMYMGGNGFYWRVAFREDLPGVLEVRRAEDGTRAWIADPGEYYHAFNGEYGGLWRRIGRSPNRLVGVGFAAQGFEKSGYYRRKPDADNPRAAFIMEGIDDEVLGDFGTIGGGAAGEEIDRHDMRLGSPAHALVVASSDGLGKDMLRTKEEFLSTIPWFDDPKVRADMTFFECPNGGAVFSTGSISYAASLSHNKYDNNIARLTSNVLRRFIDPSPFPMPDQDD